MTSLKLSLSLFIMLVFFSSCLKKNEVNIHATNVKSKTVLVERVSTQNGQIVITGTHLDKVDNITVVDGTTSDSYSIDSKAANQIIATGKKALIYGVGKSFDLVLGTAYGAATFPISFSLCDATLGGKYINCSAVPNDKDVLRFDVTSQEWKPSSLNGLSYKGVWDPSTATPAGVLPGDYYVISVEDAGYHAGDWIIYNGSTYDLVQINSNTVSTAFGQTSLSAVSNTSSTIDFSTGNLQYTSLACTSFTLNNMRNGGTYILAVKGITGGTCSFVASGLAVKKGNTVMTQTAGKHAVFTFVVMGTDVYVTSNEDY